MAHRAFLIDADSALPANYCASPHPSAVRALCPPPSQGIVQPSSLRRALDALARVASLAVRARGGKPNDLETGSPAFAYQDWAQDGVLLPLPARHYLGASEPEDSEERLVEWLP